MIKIPVRFCFECPHIRHKTFQRAYCFKLLDTSKRGGGYQKIAEITVDRHKTVDKKCPFRKSHIKFKE